MPGSTPEYRRSLHDCGGHGLSASGLCAADTVAERYRVDNSLASFPLNDSLTRSWHLVTVPSVRSSAARNEPLAWQRESTSQGAISLLESLRSRGKIGRRSVSAQRTRESARSPLERLCPPGCPVESGFREHIAASSDRYPATVDR